MRRKPTLDTAGAASADAAAQRICLEHLTELIRGVVAKVAMARCIGGM